MPPRVGIRGLCPDCEGQQVLKFIFGDRRDELCEERSVWRFQECERCGQQFDVRRQKKIVIVGSVKDPWVITPERSYELHDYLVSVGACEEP